MLRWWMLSAAALVQGAGLMSPKSSLLNIHELVNRRTNISGGDDHTLIYSDEHVFE